jgi:hypothetical protein
MSWNLPIKFKAQWPAASPRQALGFLDGHRHRWLHRDARLHLPICLFNYP